MRKNLGSAIVKRTITLAMAGMLFLGTPAMQVAAAEPSTNVETGVSAQKESSVPTGVVLTKEEQELLDKIGSELEDINMSQDASAIIDEASDIVSNNVSSAIDSAVAKATENSDAAGNLENEAAEVKGEADAFDKNHDELLNNDSSIVSKVEGNTGGIVQTIKADGQILVKDAYDEIRPVADFVREQSDIAVSAADTAKEVLNTVNSGSGFNAAEETQKLNDAVTAATEAKDKAEVAVNAAEAVLEEETSKLGELTEDKDALLTSLKALSAKSDAGSELTNKEKAMMDEYADIISALKLVNDCKAAAEEATGAVEQVKSAEQAFIDTFTGMKEQAEKVLATATNDLVKLAAQLAYDSANALLTEYLDTERTDDGFNKDLPTYKDRFDYATKEAEALIETVETKVTVAAGTLNAVNTKYTEAMKAYETLKAELAKVTEQALNDKVAEVEAKLKAAELNLSAAKVELEVAQKAVVEAVQTRDTVINILNSSTSGGSDSPSTDEGDGAVAAPSLTTLANPLVALADNIPVDDSLVTINDDPTALADTLGLDSAPKTGDSTPAALPIACSGMLAMAGAAIVNFKKRLGK